MQEIVLKLIWIVLLNLEFYSLFYVLFGFREYRCKDKKKSVFISVELFCLYICIAKIASYGQIMICMIVLLLLSQYLLWKIKLSEFLSLYVVLFLLITFLESIIEFFVKNTITLNEGTISIVCSCILLFIVWLYYFTIGHQINRNLFRLPIKLNLIIAVILTIFNLLYSYFIFLVSEIIKIKQSKWGIMLIELSGIIIVLLFFAFIYYFNTQKEFKIEKEFLNNYNKQQKNHFDIMLKKERLTREFRHDIIAELIQIKGFIQAKKYESLDEYVEEILGEISSISRYDYDVGNEVINTILNYYFVQIRNRISIEVVGYVGELDNISNKNLSVLVTNLVTNSIEAVDKVEEKDRYIRFEVKKGKLYTYIIVKNSYKKELLNITESKIYTSKEDSVNHGFGLKKIKTIIEEENGEYHLDMDDKIFVTEVRLPNK